MGETVVSLLFTLTLLWGGRDKVWTPKYEGTPEQRFVAGVAHYQQKMGLQDEIRFNLDAGTHKDGRCADSEYIPVQRKPLVGFTDHFVVDGGFTVIRWYTQSKACQRRKPEFWALHETCHIRYAHQYGLSPLSRLDREKEAAHCMKLYSAKERR